MQGTTRPAPTKGAVGGVVVVGVVVGVTGTAQGYGRGRGPRYSAFVEERYESELAQSAQVLDNVDRALERLSSGSYATCEDCGGEIDDRDLAAAPTRRTCSDCSHRSQVPSF